MYEQWKQVFLLKTLQMPLVTYFTGAMNATNSLPDSWVALPKIHGRGPSSAKQAKTEPAKPGYNDDDVQFIRSALASGNRQTRELQYMPVPKPHQPLTPQYRREYSPDLAQFRYLSFKMFSLLYYFVTLLVGPFF